MLEIADEGMSHYEEFSVPDSRTAPILYNYNYNASVFNRQILSTALLRLIEENESTKLIQQLGITLETRELAAYDGTGSIKVDFIELINTEQFSECVRVARLNVVAATSADVSINIRNSNSKA